MLTVTIREESLSYEIREPKSELRKLFLLLNEALKEPGLNGLLNMELLIPYRFTSAPTTNEIDTMAA